MEKNQEQLLTEEWLKDVSRELETKSFKAEEMIVCPQCQRKSPPTRLKCFYCGADLPVAANHAEFLKPATRKIESWEKAFNLIFLPDGKSYDETKIAEVAKLTQLEADEWRKIFAARAVLPILRVESETEATILHARLQNAGLQTRIVGDESLKTENSPRRLRRVEFGGDKIILILFNTNEVVEIARENLALIVAGALFERRIEATEQRKKRQNKTKESIETSADEMLIDVYTKDDANGFRILSTGFDFSALGDEKEFFARENMLKLVEKLRRFAPEAKFADDYLKIRDLLGKVWEVEEHRDSRGLQRKSFGRFEMEKVTTINNLSQFTKYSRLQWQLL
jgi:hypothetical protein